MIVWSAAAGSIVPTIGPTGLPSGQYTAPVGVASDTVKVCAVWSPTVAACDTAAFTVIPPTVTVVPPTNVNLSGCQTNKFSAQVINAQATTVSWSIDPNLGTIDAQSGLYTAPCPFTGSVAATVTVKATSTIDNARYAQATVTLTPQPALHAPTGLTREALPSRNLVWIAPDNVTPADQVSYEVTITGPAPCSSGCVDHTPNTWYTMGSGIGGGSYTWTLKAIAAARSSSGAVSGPPFDLPFPTPTVGSISQPNGPMAGGTPVTINGTGFRNGATVSIGGAVATGVTVGAMQITATTSSHACGTVDVVVTNSDNQSGTLSGGFFYTSPQPPTGLNPDGTTFPSSTTTVTLSWAATSGAT